MPVPHSVAATKPQLVAVCASLDIDNPQPSITVMMPTKIDLTARPFPRPLGGEGLGEGATITPITPMQILARNDITRRNRPVTGNAKPAVAHAPSCPLLAPSSVPSALRPHPSPLLAPFHPQGGCALP